MTAPASLMTLTLFMIPAGYHYDSWCRPDSRAEEIGGLPLIAEMVRRAEAAKIDAVFFGDTVDAGKVPGMDPTVAGHYEPLTAMAALAGLTEHIGLVGTASTTFSHPFNLARQFNMVDSLSGGRVGWNIVTSAGGAENFGLPAMPSPAERYRRAAEFVEVANALWASWSDDAVVVDRERALWGDPTRIRSIDHEGEFYSVRGPLNMRRSPQGRPVFAQAGSSVDGMQLGARFGELIYTAQPDLAKAVQFAHEFRELVVAAGRTPDQVKILPGFVPIIGETDADAEELANDLGRYVNLEHGLVTLQRRFDMDLSDFDVDDRIPAERFDVESANVSRARSEIFRHLAVDEGYTIRQLIVENARSHGHGWFVGSAARAAERMIEWFEAGACDGFNLNSPYVLGGLDLICDLLVPELQERGYAKTEYSPGTLRDKLGLIRHPAWDRA